MEFRLVRFTGGRSVGAAHESVLPSPIVNVVQIAVQKAWCFDRADFDFACDPVSTAAGDFFLLQAVGQRKAFVFYFEGFFVGFFRIK